MNSFFLAGIDLFFRGTVSHFDFGFTSQRRRLCCSDFKLLSFLKSWTNSFWEIYRTVDKPGNKVHQQEVSSTAGVTTLSQHASYFWNNLPTYGVHLSATELSLIPTGGLAEIFMLDDLPVFSPGSSTTLDEAHRIPGNRTQPIMKLFIYFNIQTYFKVNQTIISNSIDEFSGKYEIKTW